MAGGESSHRMLEHQPTNSLRCKIPFFSSFGHIVSYWETQKMSSLSPLPASSNSALTDSQILADYLPKLIRLAEKNLSNQLRQKVDAEEVGQSVMGSVIRQVREGKLHIEESEEFWRLIMVITLNKIRKKARHWKAQKRDMSREQGISPDGPQLAELAIDFRSLPDSPSSEEGEAFAEVLNQVDERLDPKYRDKCRQVLAARFQNMRKDEIAKLLDISTKTVDRYMDKVKKAVKQLLSEEQL
jgi:RNA polymerase sigma-70 factor (ECF subfamily)